MPKFVVNLCERTYYTAGVEVKSREDVQGLIDAGYPFDFDRDGEDEEWEIIEVEEP